MPESLSLRTPVPGELAELYAGPGIAVDADDGSETPLPSALGYVPTDGGTISPEVEAVFEMHINRALRTLARLCAQQTSNARAMAEELRTIEAHYRTVDAELQQRIGKLERAIREFFDAMPLRGKKSRKFAWGEVGKKTIPERLVLEDAGAVLAARDDGNELLAPAIETVTKTETKVRHAVLVKLWAETGVLPPGCRIEPAAEKVTITPHTD